jgi:2'-5' RNA ligase
MMLRSFIAIEIPSGIQSAIARGVDSLKNSLPKSLIRWVAPENVHLTLKFLGDVSPTNLQHLAEVLKGEAASLETFFLSVGGIGAFPNARRARVIWIGLENPPALQELQRGLEAATAKLGYSVDDRPFSPHVTLGRVGQNVSSADSQLIRSKLEATRLGILGTVRVDEVHIFKSDLRPGGSVYTHIFALPLGQVGEVIK